MAHFGGGFHGGHHGGIHHGGIHHGGIHHGGIHHGGIHHGGLHHGGIHHGGLHHGGIHHGGIHHGGIHHGGIHHGGFYHGGGYQHGAFSHGSAFTTSGHRNVNTYGEPLQCADPGKSCGSVCPVLVRFPVFFFGLATLITAAIALGTVNDLDPEPKELLDRADYDDTLPDTPDLVKNTRAVTTFIIVLFVVTVASQIPALVMRCFVACNKLRPRLLPLLIVDAAAVTVLAVCYFTGCGLAARLSEEWGKWVDYADGLDGFGVSLFTYMDFDTIYGALIANAVACALTGLFLLLSIPAILAHMCLGRKELCACLLELETTEARQEVPGSPVATPGQAGEGVNAVPGSPVPSAPVAAEPLVATQPSVQPSTPEQFMSQPLPPGMLLKDPDGAKTELTDEAPPSYRELYGT